MCVCASIYACYIIYGPDESDTLLYVCISMVTVIKMNVIHIQPVSVASC